MLDKNNEKVTENRRLHDILKCPKLLKPNNSRDATKCHAISNIKTNNRQFWVQNFETRQVIIEKRNYILFQLINLCVCFVSISLFLLLNSIPFEMITQ